MGKKTILITGVSSYWGERVAASLLEHAADSGQGGARSTQDLQVIGLDSGPPIKEIKGLDFIQADIRNPLIEELLVAENVDTVCHLWLAEGDRSSEASFDQNVMGTMKLLGACAEAGVRKVVLRSSTTVYGANPSNPAFLTEQNPLQGSKKDGLIRNLVEIETFCNGFQRQIPEVMLTILRFPGIIGPTVDTAMTRFLMHPFAPILLGFDPLMQVIHEKDVVEALVHVVVNDYPGVYNIADEGNPPLTKLIALAGKIPVPVLHWFAYPANSLFRGQWGIKPIAPIELDYLRYSWVADLTRMRDVLGFVPQYTAEEALREFAGQQRLRRYLSEASARAYEEERLRDTIERRRRMRERKTTVADFASEDLSNE